MTDHHESCDWIRAEPAEDLSTATNGFVVEVHAPTSEDEPFDLDSQRGASISTQPTS